MTEDDARTWVMQHFGADGYERLATIANLVTSENQRQSLVAASTVESIWARHIVDSAQLVELAPPQGLWIDIGSGAGFPGLVVAALRDAPMMLVEPRRQRSQFLLECTQVLGLSNVSVHHGKVERLATNAAVISARAVASVEKLLQAGAGCGKSVTRWLLPRGRSGASELAAIRQRWGGMFHMKQSLTDPESTIIICDGPARR